jgi:hypothetical protein
MTTSTSPTAPLISTLTATNYYTITTYITVPWPPFTMSNTTTTTNHSYLSNNVSSYPSTAYPSHTTAANATTSPPQQPLSPPSPTLTVPPELAGLRSRKVCKLRATTSPAISSSKGTATVSPSSSSTYSQTTSHPVSSATSTEGPVRHRRRQRPDAGVNVLNDPEEGSVGIGVRGDALVMDVASRYFVVLALVAVCAVVFGLVGIGV